MRAPHSLSLLVAIVSFLWFSPAHASTAPLLTAPRLTTATLPQLLAQARELVANDILSEGQVFTGPDAEDTDEEGPMWSDDSDRLLIMFGLWRFKKSIEKYDDTASDDPDILRITRLLACNVIGYHNGSFLPLEGKIDRQGDAQLPHTWFVALHMSGSGYFFQRTLLLTPYGLLNKTQVNDAIAALKAAGHYTQRTPDSKSLQRIRDFAKHVHGSQDENKDNVAVTEEQLIFDSKVNKGVHIIVTEEMPGGYALFFLMGQPDFGEADEGICKRR